MQIDRFAQSLHAAANGLPVPEDGYAGEYVTEWAQKVLERDPTAKDDVEKFRVLGLEVALEEIKASLARFGVEFDVWFSELSLAADGAIERALTRLRELGHVYEQDGAVWLRTTDFGDENDRVLVKSVDQLSIGEGGAELRRAVWCAQDGRLG